jgi:uncharacterized protein (TIGR02145 family)
VHNPNLNYGSLVDQSGITYKTIEIGSQVWMAENLRTTKYRNGDVIPNVLGTLISDYTYDEEWGNLTTGAWVHYNNDSQYECPYGKFYNWYAVSDARELCPNGWHVPTYQEWSTLVNYLDPVSNGGLEISTAGGKMKSTGAEYWHNPNTDATNESGFSGLANGQVSEGGLIMDIGDFGIWWTSSDIYSTNAIIMGIEFNTGNVGKMDNSWNSGYPVRCIKN